MPSKFALFGIVALAATISASAGCTTKVEKGCGGACAKACTCADENGFVSIFNGKDLDGWEWRGEKTSYYAKDGLLLCHQEGKFGGGNLWTKKEYENFILRFEFKLPREANNGLLIRCPPGGHAAYQGMEIQMLDDRAPYYWEKLKLKPYQYHGSIYGVVAAAKKPGFTGLDAPAKGTYLKPEGEWNCEEVRAVGHRITVILNGVTIVDADVSKFALDGSNTADHLPHSGLHNLSGRIGWCGHGYDVQWRNIRIKELPPSPARLDGCWAFKFPSGGSGWMGFNVPPMEKGESILWGGGSPVPVDRVDNADGTVTLKQQVKLESKRRPGTFTFKPTNATEMEMLFTAGGPLDTPAAAPQKVVARRIAPLPFRHNLKNLKYGEPIDLFKDGLAGWESMNPNWHFGWSFEDGVLSNKILRKPDGSRAQICANLVTKRRDFKDFKLEYDVLVPKDCNSGVYLRGIYELQVLDSYGKPVNCHNMAAPYGRITPSIAAEKPAGEWQHVEAILADRHVTVNLNGVNIVDNKPLIGVTGGAVTSDEFVPGPIYLQGDHSDASFRNMVLTPILKELR